MTKLTPLYSLKTYEQSSRRRKTSIQSTQTYSITYSRNNFDWI